MVTVTITYRKPADAFAALATTAQNGAFIAGERDTWTTVGRAHAEGNTLKLSSDALSCETSLLREFGFDANDEDLDWVPTTIPALPSDTSLHEDAGEWADYLEIAHS